MRNDTPVDILVVEDNDSERASIVEALQASIPDVNLLAVRNGDEALDYLFRRAAWKDCAAGETPKLILLDLAMPGTDGFSVLAQVRSVESEEALTLTPVVIFSDSLTETDVSKSYRCGANSYVIKPVSFPDFQSVVETLGRYWMTHNKVGVY
ncbi:MAG: response regulator [Candidatus Hydrogenedentota bacterium]